MSESFVKLFSAILDSSVWSYDSDTRIVWITLLTMADAKGRVHAALPGIANRARVSIDKAEEALEVFQAPDPHSRSDANDGRRIARDGRDWVILNFSEHRARQRAEAEKARKRDWWRKNRGKETKLDEKLADSSENSRPLDDHSKKTRPIQKQKQNKNKKEEVREINSAPRSPLGGSSSTYSADFLRFWDLYPKKQAKMEAFTAWKKAVKQGRLPAMDKLLAALDRHKQSAQWKRDGVIPNAARWLNNNRWEDELTLWSPQGQQGRPGPETAAEALSRRNKAVLDEYERENGRNNGNHETF
jgi:hypothetical protein